jgi:hypothetical protein
MKRTHICVQSIAMKTYLSGHKEGLIQVSYKHLYIFNWDIQSEQKKSVCMPHTLLE